MSPEVPAHAIAGIGLRDVVESDYPFLRALYRSTRDPELALTGWTEEAKQAFSDSQFGLQDRFYREHYPQTAFLAIVRGDASIGRIYIDTAPGPLRLMDIALLPAERNRGLGSAFMAWLTEWADRENRAVTLHVEALNPARRLYARHGFADDGVEGPYLKMRREPLRRG
jgi:GNAT superfamily N-acetyltransferase